MRDRLFVFLLLHPLAWLAVIVGWCGLSLALHAIAKTHPSAWEAS